MLKVSNNENDSKNWTTFEEDHHFQHDTATSVFRCKQYKTLILAQFKIKHQDPSILAEGWGELGVGGGVTIRLPIQIFVAVKIISRKEEKEKHHIFKSKVKNLSGIFLLWTFQDVNGILLSQ